jgi:2-polyprenyl-3-methyl-5-hydroxy-6-metoxy-1,4-benzoquinol methylase
MLAAMGSSAHAERLWESVPEDLEPQCFALRRASLSEHVVGHERVLDVGCGEGRFAAHLARTGARVVGIDVAEEPLRRGRSRHAELDLRLVPVAGGWPLEDASFDVVWAGEVIEHVADTAGWLSEIRRVLRPQGRLLVSTPNHGALTRLAMAVRPRTFEAHFDPLSDHLRFYTRRSLAQLLAEFRFEEIRISATGGPPGARRVLLASALRARW